MSIVTESEAPQAVEEKKEMAKVRNESTSDCYNMH